MQKKAKKAKGAIQKKRTLARKGTKQKKASSKNQYNAKDCALLIGVIDKALKLIDNIKKKESANQKSIDSQQKKFFSTKDESKKMEISLKLEGLKIEYFSKVEKNYREFSNLLNKAYLYADRLNEVIRDDFLNICRSLSNGINLPLMEKGLKKMRLDAKKSL